MTIRIHFEFKNLCYRSCRCLFKRKWLVSC